MSGGKSSKYKKQYCKQIIEFFSRDPYKEVEVKHYGNDGTVRRTEIKRIANDLPFLSQFAHTIGVSSRTLERWAKRHREFSRAYTMAKEMQKEFLIINGLLGLYNSTFAIFTAKNITDMRDQQNLKIDDDTQRQTGVIILPRSIPLEEIMARQNASLNDGEQNALPEGKQCQNSIDIDNGRNAMSQKKVL